MEYYRTKIKGERVYITTETDPRWNGMMIYRVRDGHALWGYTLDDVVLEKEWLKNRSKSAKTS